MFSVIFVDMEQKLKSFRSSELSCKISKWIWLLFDFVEHAEYAVFQHMYVLSLKIIKTQKSDMNHQDLRMKMASTTMFVCNKINVKRVIFIQFIMHHSHRKWKWIEIYVCWVFVYPKKSCNIFNESVSEWLILFEQFCKPIFIPSHTITVFSLCVR